MKRLLPDRSMYREIMQLAMPAIAGLSSQMIVTIVNTAMVGRLENAQVQLAAMSLGVLATWAITSFFSSLSTGTHVLVSRRQGEGNYRGVGEVLNNSLLLSIVVGSGISAIGYFFSYEIVGFFSSDDAVAEAGAGYLKYQFIGLPFFLLIVSYRGFFNGIGHTKVFMFSALVINVINIIFNYFFIFGKAGFPKMELAGAGMGASISMILGWMFMAFVTFLGDYRKQYQYYTRTGFSRDVIGQIVRISVPVSFQNILILLGFLVFAAITGIIGIIDQAASNVVISVLFISMMPCFGFGIAAQTLAGQALGRADLPLAQRYGLETAKLGTIFTLIIGLIFLAVPEWILLIVTTDRQVIETAKPVLQIAGVAQIFYGSGIIIANVLQAGGATVYVMFVEVLTHWIIFLPLTYILGVTLNGGVIGAWLALPVYIIAYSAMNLVKFRSGNWVKHRL